MWGRNLVHLGLISFRPGFAWQKVLEFAAAVDWTCGWLASASVLRGTEHILRGLADWDLELYGYKHCSKWLMH